jgi:hypothetical protein
LPNTYTPPLTGELTLEFFLESTLHSLEICYASLNPENGVESFKKDILDPITKLETATGDSMLSEMQKKYNIENTSANYKNSSIAISCAYCIDAFKLIQQNKVEMAWPYMAQACYWAGAAHSGIGIQTARTETILATRQHTGSLGAKVRMKKFNEAKAEAFRLAREMRPNGEPWRSARQAVLKIEKEVRNFSLENGQALSEARAVETISSWLGEMPDAAELFQTFKSKKIKVSTS